MGMRGAALCRRPGAGLRGPKRPKQPAWAPASPFPSSAMRYVGHAALEP
jgi:hypothetical protein